MFGFVCVVILFAVIPYTLVLGKVFRTPYTVQCPETGTAETVSIGVARQAVYSVLPVCDPVKLCSCSRWPDRRDCDQACNEQL